MTKGHERTGGAGATGEDSNAAVSFVQPLGQNLVKRRLQLIVRRKGDMQLPTLSAVHDGSLLPRLQLLELFSSYNKFGS